MEKKTAVGYIRVSTEEQAKDGYSLDNQELVINKKCDYEGWELGHQIFHDKGISESGGQTPGTERVMFE